MNRNNTLAPIAAEKIWKFWIKNELKPEIMVQSDSQNFPDPPEFLPMLSNLPLTEQALLPRF